MQRFVISILLLLWVFSVFAQSNLDSLQWKKQKSSAEMMIGASIVFSTAGTALTLGGGYSAFRYSNFKNSTDKTIVKTPISAPIVLLTLGPSMIISGIVMNVLGVRSIKKLKANPPASSRVMEIEFDPAGSLALRF